jgi:hypothetical protein
LIMHMGRHAFGPSGTTDDLAHWLVAAGLTQTQIKSSGPLVYFQGVRGEIAP